MQRFLPSAAIGAAFVALLVGTSRASDSVEKVDMVTVRVACDKRTVEEHLALILEDPSYKLVQERLAEDLTADKCIQTPPLNAPVLEQGRQVTFTDSDGDVMRVTVVRVAEGMWTLAGRIVGKGS